MAMSPTKVSVTDAPRTLSAACSNTNPAFLNALSHIRDFLFENNLVFYPETKNQPETGFYDLREAMEIMREHMDIAGLLDPSHTLTHVNQNPPLNHNALFTLYRESCRILPPHKPAEEFLNLDLFAQSRVVDGYIAIMAWVADEFRPYTVNGYEEGIFSHLADDMERLRAFDRTPLVKCDSRLSPRPS